MATTAAAARREEVPGWVLGVLAAVAQGVVVALVVAVGSVGSDTPGSGAYLFAAGFGAALLLAHRFPVTVLAASVLGVFAYYALDHPPIGMALPVTGAFYRCAERGRTLVAVVTGVVLLGVALWFRLGDGEPSPVLAYDVITNSALVAAALALAHAVRAGRALRAQQEQLVALERAHERVRIARDLHDSVGHALSLVSVQARVGQQALGTDDETVARSLDSVVRAARTSLADLRRTLAVLRSDGEDPDGARAPVSLPGIEHVARAARDAGLEVVVDLAVDPGEVPAAVGSTAYRIVQESLTNVLRHAGATTVRIGVTADGGALHVRVEDDGGGTGARTGTGRGIGGMQERARLLGGEVVTRTGPDGFTVEARLPLGGMP